MKEILLTVFWSLSPFGEAKVGIPYGLMNEVDPYLVYVLGLGANILVYPFMFLFLRYLNRHFWHLRPYKRAAVWIGQRAKRGSGKGFKRFGFWGLIFFVSLPIPGTGVYAGTIASYLLKIKPKTAFLANTIGIAISCTLVWFTTYATIR